MRLALVAQPLESLLAALSTLWLPKGEEILLRVRVLDIWRIHNHKYLPWNNQSTFTKREHIIKGKKVHFYSCWWSGECVAVCRKITRGALIPKILSRPGLVFQRAATVIKYYYYFYSNFTSDFFLTCSNYTCISLVKHISTSVLLQLGNSHIWDSHKRLSVSNISSSNSGRTMRSPPQSYIYITITKQLCGINMVIL